MWKIERRKGEGHFRVGCMVVRMMIVVVREHQATWQFLIALFLSCSLHLQTLVHGIKLDLSRGWEVGGTRR